MFILILNHCSLKQFVPHIFLSVLFMMSVGCHVEKSIYDSMQYEKEQQCLRDPSRNSPECIERESYETYERQRQGATQ
ncbi:MAG: hypothetical protein NPIRA05_20100 [Nitrospirales bacterium]|nr:MAG: hypothetical protein NPIRA05_20100 [Nitrospirales bacterium]